MTGLSCASPASCVATGYYLTGPVTFHALAEYWNGSTWTIQSTPASRPRRTASSTASRRVGDELHGGRYLFPGRTRTSPA